MDRNRLIFCPNLKTRLSPDLATGLTTQVIANELAANVFGDRGFAKLLKARYDQMGKLFRDAHYNDPRWNLPKYGCENCATDNKQDARLKVPKINCNSDNANVTSLFGYNNFGHDMPVWLTPRNVNDVMSRPRVMIISEDPLRDHDAAGNLYLSTPFGVHSYSFCEQIWNRETGYPLKIAEHIIRAGGIVFMTDFMKFFAYERLEGCQKGDDKNSLNPIRKNLGSVYRNLFQKSLRAEIKMFRPNLVVTLGGGSAQELKRAFAVCMRGMKIDLDYRVKTKFVCLEKMEDEGMQDISFKLITSYHPSSHGNDCTHVLNQEEPHTKQQYFNRLMEEIEKTQVSIAMDNGRT